jgi:hypothetical protein
MKKGEKMSDEQRLKIKLSKQGKGNGRLGTKHTEVTKSKMRKAAEGRDVSHLNWAGKTHTEESRKKIGEANKVRAANGEHPLTGFRFSEESKRKMSEAHIGQIPSEETRKKLSESHKGSKHWNWQGGISPENKRIRQSREWKMWRKQVFERDNYTCCDCLKTNCYLEAHHIVPVRKDKKLLFTLTNGVSLCRPCHLKTMWKEEMYEEKYTSYIKSKQMNQNFTHGFSPGI